MRQSLSPEVIELSFGFHPFCGTRNMCVDVGLKLVKFSRNIKNLELPIIEVFLSRSARNEIENVLFKVRGFCAEIISGDCTE